MQSFGFEKGVRLNLEGVSYTIQRRFDDGRVALEADDGAYRTLTLEEFFRLYRDRRIIAADSGLLVRRVGGVSTLVPGRRLSTMDPAALDAGQYRSGYLRYILRQRAWCSTPEVLAPLIRQHAGIIGDATPPSPRTVSRWYACWMANGGDDEALIPRHDRKGNRRERFGEQAPVYLQMLARAFAPESRSIVRVSEIVMMQARQMFGPDCRLPSERTFNRWVKRLPAYDVCVARYGRAKARLHFRKGLPGPEVTGILERAEIDHTPLDLFVIDKQTGLVLGRPYLTIILDTYSRMVLGFHVSFSTPSVNEVLAALRHALLGKDYLSRDYPSLKHDWPCWGLMGSLVSDNGAEFHAKELDDVCFLLNIPLQFCPAKTPYFKGKIERFLKTLNHDCLHHVPGTTYANILEKDDYDSEMMAVLGFPTLIEILHLWIVDYYHQNWHEGINDAPHRRWAADANRRPRQLPGDLAAFDQRIGRSATRRLHERGILFRDLPYNDENLYQLKLRFDVRTRLNIRYFEDDLSHIFVEHPDSRDYIRVNCAYPEYARGITGCMHRAVLKDIRARRRGITANRLDLLETKARIMQLVLEDQVSKRKVLRKRAAILVRQSSDNPDPGLPGLAPLADPVGALEPGYAPLSLDEIPEYTVGVSGALS